MSPDSDLKLIFVHLWRFLTKQRIVSMEGTDVYLLFVITAAWIVSNIGDHITSIWSFGFIWFYVYRTQLRIIDMYDFKLKENKDENA